MGGLEVLISFCFGWVFFCRVSYKMWGAEGGREGSVTKTSTHNLCMACNSSRCSYIGAAGIKAFLPIILFANYLLSAQTFQPMTEFAKPHLFKGEKEQQTNNLKNFCC